MTDSNQEASFQLLAKLGKAGSPREAGTLLEKESALVDRSFIFLFTDPVAQQLTSTVIFPREKFEHIYQLVSERYNVTLILELFQMPPLEWVFFFIDHQDDFLFPFTDRYFDILLDGESGRRREYILHARESIVRFAAARDLLDQADHEQIPAKVRQSLGDLDTAQAKNYLADFVSNGEGLRDKALFCLQTIADSIFNAPLDFIRNGRLKDALIRASSHPEPGDQARAMSACIADLRNEPEELDALVHFHIAHALLESRIGEPSANIEAALQHLTKAEKVFTETNNPFAWARVQNGFARCYGMYQKHDAANNIELALTHQRLAAEAFSEVDHPYDWAYAQNNLGSLYLDRLPGDKAENIKQAITFFESALTVQSRLYCPEAWALSTTNLGEAYNHRVAEDRLQRAPQAIALFEQVAELYTEEQFPFEWAVLQRRIGNAYMTLASAEPFKHVEVAMSHFLKAQAILTVERYPIEWTTLMRQMGDAFASRVQGDPMVNQESAIACYMSSFAIITHGTQPYSWATLHHALALIYRLRVRGSRSENVTLGLRHIAEAKRVLTKDRYPDDWASLEHLQGILVLELRKPDTDDDYKAAIKHFSNALSIRTRDSSFHLWTESMNSLAGVYTDWKGKDQEQHLQTGIALYQEVLSVLRPEHNLQNWCTITTDLARAYINSVAAIKEEEAKNLLEEVLKVQTPITHPRECFKVAFQLGLLHHRNKRFRDALSAFRMSFESAENLRAQSIHGFVRQQVAADTSELFQRMVSCCLELRDIDQALYYASAGKARVFADRLQPREPSSEGVERPEKAVKLNEQIDQLRKSIDEITTSKEYVLTGGYFKNRDKQTLLSVVAAKRQELFTLLEEMALRFPDFSDARSAPNVPVDRMKRLSTNRPGECWIEYYKHMNGWCAFIIHEGKVEYADLPGLSYELLNDTFNCINQCEKEALSGRPPAFPDHKLEKLLATLYRSAVEPLALPERNIHKLVIAASRELALVPVNIAFNIYNGRYLSEEYALSFVPGLNALYWLIHWKSGVTTKSTSELSLLGVAHPGHTKATRLQFAYEESAEVAKYFAAPPASHILSETQALVADIIRHATQTAFNCIHFACHGSFNTEDPAHSGLLLQDGILTAERIQSAIRLQGLPMVILSACQTAQVSMTEGDEIIGLIQSFFSTGAGAVIASQWSVNDASSLEVFRHFFEYWKSMPAAQALQSAAMSVRSVPGWSHPLYWAAFTITGMAD